MPGRAPLPPVWWVCRSGDHGGGVLSLSPAYPAFSLLSFPPSPKGKDIPPPALAERSSPPGKGEIFSFLMQGASPLASPGLNPGGTYSPSKTGTQRGACPCVAGGGGRWRCPKGGVLFLSPAYPAFSLLSFPYPPDPLPLRGRGRSKVYFAGGFAPGTPALDRLRHLQALPCRYPAAEPGRHHSRGTSFFRLCGEP